MDDLISRQDAIKAICEDGTWLEGQGRTDISMAERKQRDADILSDLPSVQSEPAIPLSWIEEQIKWLKSLDNGFSNLAAMHISAMVNKWKDEQNE